MAGTTSPGWPRCSSTRAPRSTSRASPTPTRTASHGHARWSGRGRVAKRWNDCAARLISPDDAHDDALNRDVALVETQRRHGGIRRLEPDPPSRLAIEALDGGARALHQRDHGLAIVGLVALVHHDEIAVLDVLVDHRLTPNLQHVTAAAAGYQLVGHRDGVAPAHRLDRLAGRDQSVQRQLAGPGLTARRHDLDAATFVVRASDVALALEVGEVLVHRGERAERELLRDLFKARCVPVRADLGGDAIQNFVLTACERPKASRTTTETKPT